LDVPGSQDPGRPSASSTDIYDESEGDPPHSRAPSPMSTAGSSSGSSIPPPPGSLSLPGTRLFRTIQASSHCGLLEIKWPTAPFVGRISRTYPLVGGGTGTTSGEWCYHCRETVSSTLTFDCPACAQMACDICLGACVLHPSEPCGFCPSCHPGLVIERTPTPPPTYPTVTVTPWPPTVPPFVPGLFDATLGYEGEGPSTESAPSITLLSPTGPSSWLVSYAGPFTASHPAFIRVSPLVALTLSSGLSYSLVNMHETSGVISWDVADLSTPARPESFIVCHLMDDVDFSPALVR
jgi:hypothetical protein